MIVAKVNFPDNYKNDLEKQDIYLANIKHESLSFLKLYYFGNNRDIKDIKSRLTNLQDYLLTYYNININIYNIIKYIIENLKYDGNRTNIILDDELKLKGVKILTIIKIIKYGSLNIKGCDILDKCLKMAFKSVYVNNFLVNYLF